MYVTVAGRQLANKHLASQNLKSMLQSESIVLSSAKSMKFNKLFFFYEFDLPRKTSETTLKLSPIFHCVHYQFFKLQTR